MFLKLEPKKCICFVVVNIIILTFTIFYGIFVIKQSCFSWEFNIIVCKTFVELNSILAILVLNMDAGAGTSFVAHDLLHIVLTTVGMTQEI